MQPCIEKNSGNQVSMGGEILARGRFAPPLNEPLVLYNLFDQFSLLTSQVGIVTLLYFLVDNMFSKNRLTPRKIKIW